MKLLLLLSFMWSFAIYAQLEDGRYYFIGSTHYLEFDAYDDGWSLSDVILINLFTGEEEAGTGYWHKINMNGVGEDYEGPEGFYEFQTDYCNYEFDAPGYYGEMIEFRAFDCENSGSIYMDYSTEIEAGMQLRDIMEGGEMGEGYEEMEWDAEDMDFSEFEDDFEEMAEFDYEWANEGYDNIEALLRPWTTQTGTALQESILKFQPTLDDCKKVFSDDDYMAAYAAVTAAYAEMLNDINNNPEQDMGYSYVRVQPMNFEQPYVKLFPRKGPFKLRSPLMSYYRFSLLESETSSFGRSMTFIVKIDGRYVIFPQD